MSNTKNLLTSTPANNRQTSSELFSTYGITSQIPGPVSLCGVLPLSTILKPYALQYSNNISRFVIASSLKTEVAFHATKNILTASTITSKSLCQPPDLVLSFPSRELKETVAAAMLHLGFSKQSTGRNNYYKGRASQLAVNEGLKNGAELDTPAPYGACNIEGYLAFTAIHKLIVTTVAIISEPFNTSTQILAFGDDWKIPPQKKSKKFFFDSRGSLTKPGVFVPYFPGLNLPEKNQTVEIIARRFTPALGKDPEEIHKNLRIIRSGWRSLATSPQGVLLSHMAFCLDLALTTGARPRFFMPNGLYGGTVLEGTDLEYMKANTRYTSIPVDDLRDAVFKFDMHETKLQEILDIFNEVFYKDDDDTTNYIKTSQVTQPRLLHNLFRGVTLTTEQTSSVRKALVHLRFSQKLWDPSDAASLIQVTQAIASDTFLDDAHPIAYQTEAFFSKDIISSTLSAFGATAPSFSTRTSNYTIPLTTGNFYKEKMPNGVTLKGLPIYVVPLSEAVTQWKQVRRSGAISIKTGGLDKEKYTKLPGVTYYLHFYERDTIALGKTLSLLSTKERERSAKRAREDDAEEPLASSRAKRLKVTDSSNLSVAAGFFTAYAEEVESDVEMS